MASSSSLKSYVPPIALDLLRKILNRGLNFSGDYATWSAAVADSTGYDASLILDQVRASALRVKSGEAVFERDSVCFKVEEFRWPTLACLLRAAAEKGGELRVLDFGGSLGSFYFQHRKHFRRLKLVHWAVIEQPQYVACGRAEMESEVVKFYETVDACLVDGDIDIILFSSVLQYLEKPYDTMHSLMRDLANSGARYVLIDRTPFISGTEDRLMIQKVPSSIYSASYPAWFLSWQSFLTEFARLGLKLELEFTAEEDAGIGQFKGALFEIN